MYPVNTMNEIKTVYISTKDLWKSVCGLSEPTKMPGFGYSISAKKCKTGSKLHKIKGSVCFNCYARRGNYQWFATQSCLTKRQNVMERDINWVSNMVELIKRKGHGFFRWFDSGDLQNIQMLHKIVEVCRMTPDVNHWLPTKEYRFVQSYIKSGQHLPSNLVIRLSGYMIDGEAPVALANRLGVNTSSVTKTQNFTCPASNQQNECGSCRKCWNKEISNVVYKYH